MEDGSIPDCVPDLSHKEAQNRSVYTFRGYSNQSQKKGRKRETRKREKLVKIESDSPERRVECASGKLGFYFIAHTFFHRKSQRTPKTGKGTKPRRNWPSGGPFVTVSRPWRSIHSALLLHELSFLQKHVSAVVRSVVHNKRGARNRTLDNDDNNRSTLEHPLQFCENAFENKNRSLLPDFGTIRPSCRTEHYH